MYLISYDISFHNAILFGSQQSYQILLFVIFSLFQFFWWWNKKLLRTIHTFLFHLILPFSVNIVCSHGRRVAVQRAICKWRTSVGVILTAKNIFNDLLERRNFYEIVYDVYVANIDNSVGASKVEHNLENGWARQL